jgi:hypothetical protein
VAAIASERFKPPPTALEAVSKPLIAGRGIVDCWRHAIKTVGTAFLDPGASILGLARLEW